MKKHRIEIDFPFPVELPPGFTQALAALVGMACKKYEKENPGRVMWAAEHGDKVTFMPLSREEETQRGMEFDDLVYHIGVVEKERSERRII